MSVYQRSDGRWVCKLKDTSRRPHKWVQKTFRTKEEADEFEDQEKQDAREGSRLTVCEAVGLYLNDHTLCRIVERQYRWLVGGSTSQFSRRPVGYAEFLADRYVDSLDRRDLNEVRLRCREGGCCNATTNNWVGKLCAVFNYCAEEGLIDRNPWSQFRTQLEATHESRQATLEAFQAIYPHLPPWLQWACRTALALCLRPGFAELFSLKWSAFDFAHGAVKVWMGKVGAAKTVFPVAEYMAEAWERFKADGRDKSLCVCRSATGKTVTCYKHAWRGAFKRAGQEPFPMYALRHIAASQMLAAGADVAAVAANLGHANPQTTLRAYAHALPQAQKAASEALGAVWCKKELPEPVKSGS